MKTWFKILKGDVESNSQEISLEMDNLKDKKQEKANKVDQLTDALKAAKLERLAGAENQKEIQSIEKELSESKSDLEVLTDALDDFARVLSKTVEKETLKEIETIEKEIRSLSSERDKIKEKFLKMVGEAAGLWSIINRSSAFFRAGINTRPFPTQGKESEIFNEAVQKGIDGRKPIPDLIYELHQRRSNLVKTLPVEI